MQLTTSSNRTVVAAATLIAILAGWAGGQTVSPQQQQGQAKQDELKLRTERERQEKLARLKDRFMLQVQQANDTLAKIATANDNFTKQMNDLLTSDDGKRLVRDPVSFKAYLDMHDHPCVSADDIKVRQKAAASIADGLKAEAKEIDVGWLPSPETLQEATEIYLWARDRATQLDGQQAAIKTMLEKAPKLDDASKSPTLSKAIEEYHARWYQLLAESHIIGEKAAEPEAKQIAVDAARLAKLEEAKAEYDKLLEQKRTELAQMKAAYEEKLLQAQADAKRQQVEAEEAYKDALARLDRRVKDAATSRAAKDTEAEIQRNAVAEEAKKKEDLALIKSREVQDLLAPFFAKGYWQPGVPGGAYEKQPISLSGLAAVGALKPTPEGLQKLIRVAVEPDDKERQRWPYSAWIKNLTPAQRDEVMKAQKLIIEQGKLMVSEGLLSK